MKQILYILCGLPFSGKSTLAEKLASRLEAERIDLDEVKFELYSNTITDDQINQEGWDRIYKEMYRRIEVALKSGKTVINDTGNFTKSERNIIKGIANEQNIESKVIYVNTSKEIAYQRLVENRNTQIRFDVSDKSFETTVKEMEPPIEDENVIIYNQNDDIESWLKKYFS